MSGWRRFSYKYISDAVHGTIGISELERAVMDTAAFRRLRGIKQLGLASTVYPTADYTRFSHSLGACHVAGRLCTQLLLQRNGDDAGLSDEDAKQIQLHRLAGMLHDIGHYPFSHALELAVANYYSGAYLTDSGLEPRDPKEFFKDHEDVGLFVLETDAELRQAIEQNDLGITSDDVAAVFKQPSTSTSGDSERWFPRLISSDVDADRLDYLSRTAVATGLPYGHIDLDYLISQVREDDHGRIAFGRNALRAIDQLLIGRFFDYRQVSFHKTVAAMEWLLIKVIPALLHVEPQINLSKEGIKSRIEEHEWGHLTDSFVWELIEQHWRKAKAAPARSEDAQRSSFTAEEVYTAEALIERRPPKLVAGVERFQRISVEKGEPNLHRLTVKMANDFLPKWAETFKIPCSRWTVWERKIAITKVGSKVSAARAFDSGEKTAGKYEETARLLVDNSEQSTAAVHIPQSLTSILSEFDYRMIRVFVLLDKTLTSEQQRELRKQIFDRIATDMSDAGWTYPRKVGDEEAQLTNELGEGEEEDEEALDPAAEQPVAPAAAPLCQEHEAIATHAEDA